MQSVPIPQSADGYDGNPMVTAALEAMTVFARPDLDFTTADMLLRHWKYFHQLTELEVEAVRRRLPGDRATRPEPGGGYISGSPTWLGMDLDDVREGRS